MCSTCDPRKLVVSHPQHEKPRLQAATLSLTTSPAPAPNTTYTSSAKETQKSATSFMPKNDQSDEFGHRRVQLATEGSNRKAPLDADTMRTVRKARTPEMKRRATQVATERQAAWKSMQPKPWQESPARGNDLLATAPGYHLENGAQGPQISGIELRVERDTSLCVLFVDYVSLPPLL